MRNNRSFRPALHRGIVPAAAAVTILLTSAAAMAGATPEQKCQDAVTNAASKYYSAALDAISSCEAGRADGGIPEATNCRPSLGAVGDSATSTALSSARTKLGDSIDKKCSEVTISSLSFGKPCESVANTTDLTDCIADDAHGKDAENLVGTVYGDGGTVAAGTTRDCQLDSVKAAGKLAKDRLKARRKCAKSIVSGKTTAPCPDAKTNAKFDKSAAKLKETVEGSCSAATLSDPDLTPGFPCDLFANATFERQGNTINNRLNPSKIFGRCIAAAGAGSGDLGSETANPLDDPAPFSYGVAAGDATDTAFVVWTRTTDGVDPVTLQVSTDPTFATIANTQMLSADVAADNVVKAEVTGLTAGTQYYYRFTQDSSTSRVGRIQTAPSPASTQEFTFAFTGDANAHFKPFTVLEQVTEADPDLWLFIGDTIYGDDARSGTGVAEVRSEYHTKYKENRTDRSMRDLMANVGTYTIWDDHEVTNDIWGTNPATVTQMQQGSLAYRDYMPIRVDGGDPMKLYRSFKWGDVAEFFLIDTRQYRDSQADITEPDCVPGVCSITTSTSCVDSSDCLMAETCMKGECSETGDPCNTQMDCDLVQPGQFCDQNQGMTTPNATCQAEIDNPSRTYLGATQLAWLQNGLLNSTATFKFVMNGPLISELGFVPYDRWEGYSAERNAFLDFVSTNDIRNVVFLSTDIHAAIVNDDVDGSGYVRELVAGAIGMDPIYRELPPAVFSVVDLLPVAFPTVKFYDIDRFNVATATVSQNKLQMTWSDVSGQTLLKLSVDAE